jgi:hypothetical protein
MGGKRLTIPMGDALRRIWLPPGVATLPWNERQLSSGISGNSCVASVATFAWNGWQLSRGIRKEG